MASSGVIADPECMTAWNKLKLEKKDRYVIYKIADDYKSIIVDESVPKTTDCAQDYLGFREKLLAAKSKDRKGVEGIGGRYAAFDYEYTTDDGRQQSKLVFFSWTPDEAAQYPRMMYSASKEALRRALDGRAVDIQANDKDDLEPETVKTKISTGR